ncbi:Transcriptional elongation regulator MINIYO [Quillaja saponaria]|uniref:Transcriptional elongation regulator MINIYO n=1 Tax=Quillaja saponaria TaxID=32244 RepID=A0AAD7KYE7_QUISA|nr:Transcriptional elongation regulator MINIYO [Quillaja saponaria]
MDSLVRLRYLLETDPTAALEECIILVLLALARHSPFCANAIMKCERLIQTIVHRFTVNNMEIQSSMIKSISLFKVLARSDKKNCLEFVKNGYFQAMTWHLYQSPSSVDHWVKSGKEKCKLSSALIVEQLRFWKVCIQYGYCVTYFSDLFPALCLWLNPPTFEKLIVNNILSEFASISGEAYLVLEALARRLPNFFLQKHLSDLSPKCTSDDKEIWSWSYVTPMVDLAAKWIATKGDPHVSKFFKGQEGVQGDFAFQNLSSTSLLWLYSAVMYMLFRVLERLTPDDTVSLHETGELVPWLPEFVPKIGLELIKYRFLGSLVSSGTESGKDSAGGASFIQELTYLRQQSDYETSVASVCCLSGLIKIIITMDNLIQSAKTGISGLPFPEHSLSREGKMLRDGILSGSVVELKGVLNVFINLVASEWQCVQSIEMFGRGGPAPGVGIGWGASGGGFWSKAVLLAQTDAEFLIHMLEAFHKASSYISPSEETTFNTQRINSSLGLCLTAGPRDRVVVDKALDILFHVSVLKYLDLCIRQFLLERRNKTFGWQFKEEDYLLFSKILVSHFRSRWLSVKEKSKATDGNSSAGNKTFKKVNVPLNTIYEEVDVSTICNQDCTSLTVEWAYQRLPLPIHFYLSPISTICDSKWTGLPKDNTPIVLLEVAKSGLFFLLGIETMSNYQVTDAPSPVQSVPLIWKLHSLSVSFLAGMEVLEEEKSRGIFEALQDLYGELLDKERSSIWEEYISGDRVELTPETENKTSVEFLRFQSEIHESYSTFIEGLVEQFSAISYGDLIFGRQVAFYLHRCVESPIRLAAWNALSNAHVLDILPPLDKCFSEAGGYLEPC